MKRLQHKCSLALIPSFALRSRRAVPTTDSVRRTRLELTATGQVASSDAQSDSKLAHEMFGNTGVFNVTGHPALTIPCETSDGLPIGMMLVGKHFDESSLYRPAYAFEQAGSRS